MQINTGMSWKRGNNPQILLNERTIVKIYMYRNPLKIPCPAPHFSITGTPYLGLLKRKHMNTSEDTVMEYEVGRSYVITSTDLGDNLFHSLASKHSTLAFRSLAFMFL